MRKEKAKMEKNDDEFFKCPHCHKKMFKLNEGYLIKNIEIKCGRCKKIIKINMEPKRAYQ